MNSASLESLIPTEAANFARIQPFSSRNTPSMSVGPALPLGDPSTFHFQVLGGGSCQCDSARDPFHYETPSKFETTSPRLTNHKTKL